MRIISSKNTVLFPLGKQGENLAQKIIFCDPVAWTKEYGTGTVQLLNQRPGEDTPYPVAIAEEADGSYSWVVTAADTALAGQGKCELRYLSGDTVVKSRIWSTIVNDALGEPSDTPPESQQGWVDQVLAAGTSAQDAAKRAEAAAINQPYPNEETGTWWVWDAEAGAYKNTGISYGVGGGSVELDTTLKESGKAADAASVGDALSTLSEEKMDNEAMSATTLGGAMADPAEAGDTQPVRIGNDKKLYTATGGGSQWRNLPVVKAVTLPEAAQQITLTDLGIKGNMLVVIDIPAVSGTAVYGPMSVYINSRTISGLYKYLIYKNYALYSTIHRILYMYAIKNADGSFSLAGNIAQYQQPHNTSGGVSDVGGSTIPPYYFGASDTIDILMFVSDNTSVQFSENTTVTVYGETK